MKRYVGVKLVEAKPMNQGEYHKYRAWRMPENGNPEDEGYLIRYVDGYESWSPRKQFDAAYREFDEGSLPATAIDMISPDYKKRFQAEYRQVVIRYLRLKDMLHKWDSGELQFSPSCPRSTYNMQLQAMTDYIAVLEARAVMEQVELDF